MSVLSESRMFRLPRFIVWIVQMIIGGTFVYASLDKIAHPDAFAQIVYYYRMLPESLLHLMALYLPWLELITGLALITGVRKRGAAMLVSIMLAMFVVALLSAISRDLDISCGCFSTGEGHGVGWDLIRRDIVMFFGCILILFQRR